MIFQEQLLATFLNGYNELMAVVIWWISECRFLRSTTSYVDRYANVPSGMNHFGHNVLYSPPLGLIFRIVMSTNQETSDSDNFIELSIIEIKKKSFKLNHGDPFCEIVSKWNHCDVSLGRGGMVGWLWTCPGVIKYLIRVFQFYTGYSLRLT